ncbi:MAG: aspartate aminotransferase family protein [Actinomycetota bacterium]
MGAVDRARLGALMERERASFEERHPRSKELWERARGSLLSGVPMNWMTRWPGAYPVFVREAHGARFTDVDGNEFVDLCLGDTGAMTGHSPEISADAIAEQAHRGITLMLPTEDSIWVGEEMARRFGLAYWQFALTATDANRFVLRLARQITGRPKVLVYNWCYHGSVDETVATIRDDGSVGPRVGSVGPQVDPALTTKVIEFNDVDALERALEPGDVACVLAEPALTNIGIVLPEPGYHEAIREITRRTGTLLVIDETHTICSGPGGYTRAHKLDPDFLTIGKPLASGVPTAAYGISQETSERILGSTSWKEADVGGIGGTLAGNALSLHAMRATLEHVLTEKAYGRMIPLAERFTAGVESVIEERHLPWHITRLGCRAEYLFQPDRPRNGSEAAARADDDLDAFMHLYALNRGILLTPFHNMALMSPATTQDDVDRHTQVYGEAADELIGA